MKHTPLTDQGIYNINTIIVFLDTLKDEEVFYKEGGPKIIELFDYYFKLTLKIEIDAIKSEFWDLSNDFTDPQRLKNIYKIKFKQLLNWTDAEKLDSKFILDLLDKLLFPFINRHNKKSFNVDMEAALKINTSFLLLITSLFTYKEEIESLLEQCDAYAGIYQNNDIREPEIKASVYGIASKRKTDVIKILSTMYDNKMFVDKDGNAVTNKQKLMDSFGMFLGEDFSAYSSSLSQAKTRDEKTYMKPFKEMENEALRYFNAVED